MVEKSNQRRLRIGEEKKTEDKRRQKKPQDKNIMACPVA